MNEAWFSALGEALGDDERREIAAYLAALGMSAMALRQAHSWGEAGEISNQPAET